VNPLTKSRGVTVHGLESSMHSPSAVRLALWNTMAHNGNRLRFGDHRQLFDATFFSGVKQ
jgi:hypothetical protein